MKFLRVLTLFFIAVLVLSACTTKNSEIDYNPNVHSAQDLAFAEDAYREVFNVLFIGTHDPEVLSGEAKMIHCCVVSYDEGENRMNFSYGSVNRLCDDNVERRGIYYAQFDGPVTATGTLADVVIDSIFFDDDKISGTILYEVQERTSENKQQYLWEVTNGSILVVDTTETSTIAYQNNYTATWEEGEATPSDFSDDVIHFTGSTSGISSTDESFTSDISEPLVNNVECYWMTSGLHILDVPMATVKTGEVDYITTDLCRDSVNFYFDGNMFYHILAPKYRSRPQ